VPDVLIATDADWIFDEVDAALADEETTVHRVRRGRDVSEAARRIQPELIVLDMQIGNMGGVATAIDLHLEADAGRVPDARILLLLDREADHFLAKRAAVDAELVKPLDAGTLRRTLKRLLGADAPV
jgi:DNA-binding response OmpR family regulator